MASTYIYEVYDKGKLIFEGSVKEVAKEFSTGETTVPTAYFGHYRYIGKYVLKRRKRKK